MLRTLRWRLTFWYGAVAAVLLLLFALIPIVFLLVRPSTLAPESSVEVREAAALVDRTLQETSTPSQAVEAAREPGVQVVIRDAGGAVLASSADPGGLPETDPTAASYPEVQRAENYIATRLEAGDPQQTIVEVFSGPVFVGDPVLRGLVPLQAGGILVALLIMVALGPALAAGALRPLRRVNEVAGELRRGRLESRVDLPELKSRNDEVGQVATSFDEMAESLEQLVKAERESKEGMRRFLADASHELRTPLTSILGYLDVLDERGEEDGRVRDRAHAAIREEGDRMTRLVEDLLTLARLESRQEMHAETLDLAALAHDVAKSYPEPRVAVAAEEPVELVSEPDALRRVISNLLSNAARHTPPEGDIEVFVECRDGEAMLRVSDTGTGIPEGDLPHIFERFYRPETSRSGEGVGLGLAIVHETVEALGGRVEVESVLGKGSTFTVVLPLSGGG